MDNFRFTAPELLELNPLVKKIWLISFVIFIIIFSMLFLPWQQTVKGKGKVIAYNPSQRDYTMVATIDGYIDNFYVQENQFVKKGTLLYTMVDLDSERKKRLQENKKATKEQRNNIKAEIVNLQENEKNLQQNQDLGLKIYNQRLLQIKNTITSLEFQKESLQTNYKVQKNNFKRVSSLYKEGIESKREYEKLQNSFITAENELKKNAIDIQIQKKNIEILMQEKNTFLNSMANQIKAMQNKILLSQNKMNSLTQTLNKQMTGIKRYESRKVLAKKDGYVVRIFNNDKDKYIRRGEKILHFSPIVTQKAILLKVSDFNMPLVKEGLPTRIMFYGWPALQISGWPKIQFGSYAGIVAKTEKVSHEEGYYYAYVLEGNEAPWPKGDNLRIGTKATVWVRLATVPLWYQIWRLMNALPPKMVNPDRKKY